ncbi:uncharacterized protein LOC131000100 isoform X2 [Salvia miltiorrhiza]|uniref:uncharacterized protein LOC131000100 isoform X2 n=1 Tax=Salvia miltiorrhiza TaxID=226208 RepID=UPI0025AD742F|nr:uncharacterized protein LOC131000100 isoform X2 [Salvia miltiorrhiza]
MAESTVSMKLLIDKRGKRVVFAEAGKDCVDFLFSILSLPVATIIRLLREEGMDGSLPNLYKSLENLNDDYIEPDKKKDFYLKPVSSSSLPLLALEAASSTGNNSYRCNYCSHYIDPNAQVVSGDGSLVKGVVTYMVMDDLEIKPMSTISSITLLNDFNVKYVGALKEKVVHLGMDEKHYLI